MSITTKEGYELLRFAAAHPRTDYTMLSVYNGPIKGRYNRRLMQHLVRKGFLKIQMGQLGQQYCQVTLEGEDAMEEYKRRLHAIRKERTFNEFMTARILLDVFLLVFAVVRIIGS